MKFDNSLENDWIVPILNVNTLIKTTFFFCHAFHVFFYRLEVLEKDEFKACRLTIVIVIF